MTKKRFEIYDEENGYVKDNKTGKSYSACGGGDGFPFIINEYHRLQKENEELKKRNENQYNQLNEVWDLIHRREWEILVDMDNKMEEDEERLRNEWKCYE